MTGVASLWNDVVANLERSVEATLISDDPEQTLRSIKLLRQFVVASATNKTVVGTSKVLRPRLMELLGRLQCWSSGHKPMCFELCGLINSLVRDCSALSTHILSNPDLLTQLFAVILCPESGASLRETCLLLLRSLFRAEDLSAVLSQADPLHIRRTAAMLLFTETTLQGLINLVQEKNTDSHHSINEPYSSLTNNVLCYLIQILALLSTDVDLVMRLHRLNAIQLCHDVIMSTVCTHSKPAADVTSVLHVPTHHVMFCATCIRTGNPNMLTVRFALKLLVHLFFHVDNALDVFIKTCRQKEAFQLLACYEHLISATPVFPGASRHLPSDYYDKHMTKPVHEESNRSGDKPVSTASPTRPLSFSELQLPPSRVTFPITSYVPSAHGTQVFLGLLRGLIYWRMISRAVLPTVDAVDQFGSHVASSSGVNLTDDDVALMVIQPLTEGCLYIEDIRILSWICHVLVLVLDGRPQLHLWTVYTNSFIREINGRITSMINAVQEASDYHNYIQFLEHLIPLVKLLACLASACETIRVLFTETSMCKKLIDFTLNLKPLGQEHSSLVLEFQHSIAVLMHVLSRSFGAHHSYFRQEQTVIYLIQLVEDNLASACRGHVLCANLVEAASSVLVNILLPMSPPRQGSTSLLDRSITLFIHLIKSIEHWSSHSSASPTETLDTTCCMIELTADLRSGPALSLEKIHHKLSKFRLNGIWGLANILHSATSSFCSDLFDRLVSDGAWLELLRPVQSPSIRLPHRFTDIHLSGHSALPMSVRRVSLESGLTASDKLMKTLGLQTMNSNASVHLASKKIHVPHSASLPSTTESVCRAEGHTGYPIQLLLVYHTLMLLRNLLRHKKIIDSIVNEHWWNITQLLTSVLEGDYPQPVKEQAILVLAHIANGQTALEQLHRNEDLTEKIKLFMRSPNNYTKAAALTATYNLLGLWYDNSDTSMFTDATKQSIGAFFLPHHRRLHHRHHRHKDRSKRKHDSHSDIATSSPPSEPYRRDLITCVAQSALQETEEVDEEEDEQDVVLEHGDTVREIPLSTNSTRYSGSAETESLAAAMRTIEDSTSFSIRNVGLGIESSATGIRRNRHVYRSWETSLGSPCVLDTTDVTTTLVEGSDASPGGHPRSSSGSSGCSDSSSVSCAEEVIITSAQVTEIDRSVTQNMYEASPTCSESETKIVSCEPVHESETGSHSISIRAPLAEQEVLDEPAPHSPQIQTIFTTTERQSPSADDAERSVIMPVASSQSQPCDVAKSSASQSDVIKQPTCVDATRSRRSLRDWEVGFHQVLLPFLQELESSQTLRSTWDWLMLRASTRGRPIQLHQLFTAWQRLYDTIPSSSLPTTNFEFVGLNSSLFTNCLTVDSFLQRLRESAHSSSSVSSSRNPAVRRDVYHHHPRRRHHHHCHRHQIRTHSRRVSDRVPPFVECTTAEETSETPASHNPEDIPETSLSETLPSSPSGHAS